MKSLKTPVTVLAILAAMTACSGGSGSTSGTTTSPATFEVTGAMTVSPDYAQLWRDAGGAKDAASIEGLECQGGSGYGDIATGSQVTVRDGAGKVVAVGQLAKGVARPVGKDGEFSAANCSFALTVNGVPKGSAFYSVEVAHRGQVQFAAADIQKPLSLNLE